MTVSQRLLRISLLLIFPLAALSAPAMADSLTISYTSSQNQTALVGATGFTVVTFFGSITNNTGASIAFNTVGSGPVTPDPYVAGFVGAFPFTFPPFTLGPGANTGNVALATVTLNPFDPSLTYPSTRLIKVEAVIPSGVLGGTILGENDAMIQVVSSVPEPPTVLLFASSLLGLVILSRKSRIARPGNLA
jgi:PEP-CTERM motif